MSEILIGISLLLFAICWKYIWQKTLLDYSREQLIDLHSEFEDWTINNGYHTNNKIYRQIQSRINYNIKIIEKMTLFRYISLTCIIETDSKNNKRLYEDEKLTFRTGDKKFDDFAETIFQKMLYINFSYMIFRNLFLCLLFFILGIFFIVKSCFSTIQKKVFCPQLATNFTIPIVIGFISLAPLFRLNPTVLEKYKYMYTLPENIIHSQEKH